MSSLLQTYSRFLFGFVVTNENNKIDFNEGAGDLVASIDPGSYSLGKYAEKIEEAMNLAGLNEYAVTVDRLNRTITITSDVALDVDFLFSTGTNLSQSAAPMMGFNLTDHLNQTFVTSDNTVGDVYDPQFWLQSYVPPENSRMAAFATKNKSASGKIKVQRFGIEQFMKCDIKYATNVRQLSDNSPIIDNEFGLQDLRDFLTSVTNQTPVEFYPDIDDTDTYYTLILESTPDSKDGTGFELREMNNFQLSGYFETGKLVFRVTGE